MYSIKKVLMERDGYSSEEADEAIEDAKVELQDRLHDPETHDYPEDLCRDSFGLEEDYIFDLID